MTTTFSPCEAMRRLLSLGWLRRGIIGGALGVLLLLAGCSAVKLGYRQGPVLAGWWLDGQLDLDAAQSARVRDELQRWFDWHARTQLPGYAQQLVRLRAESQGVAQPAQLCRWNETLRELVSTAVEPLLPAAAEVALTLTPAQIDHLERKQVRRTAELREEMLLPDPSERRMAMTARTVKRFEEFYGRLSGTQRRLIEEALSASPFDLEQWLRQREQRQRELVGELRRIVAEKPPPGLVQERLRRLVRRFDGRDPVGPPQQAAALSTYNCAWAARLHNSASAEQRERLADKLRNWESDFRALASEAAPALADAGPASLR